MRLITLEGMSRPSPPEHALGWKTIRQSGTDDHPLWEFLLRHPFSSHSLLEGAFGESVVGVLLEREAGCYREVEVPSRGTCYAAREEPNTTLLGCHRWELAREFALAHMGQEAVRSGISPGFDADGEFCWANARGVPWWRIWVDMGLCAPEALPFVVNPPMAFGDHVCDVVVTCELGRLDPLAAQIERNWECRQPVRVWLRGSEACRIARPREPRRTRRWHPPTERDVKALIRERQRGSHHRSYLARLYRSLSAEDWRLLGEVGNNPLFSTYELAYLRGDSSRTVRKEIDRVQRLEDLGLIQTARDAGPRCAVEGRKVLTWRGLELLAEHWGASLDAVRRFHPWPQREDTKGKGHVEYATRWASQLEAHQRLTRQFALALLHGARCVSNDLGGAGVRIETTIASRICFMTEFFDEEERISWVAPDLRARVKFWRREILHGEPMPPRLVDRRALLVELDRGTVAISRLEERLDRYARIWRMLEEQRPVLVWVIDGSPSREKRILDGMRERKLEGWTVTLERLVLPEEDKWWLIRAPASRSGWDCRVGLPWKAIGGMAPWRRIWMPTGEPGLQPFLGTEPWLARDAARVGELAG